MRADYPMTDSHAHHAQHSLHGQSVTCPEDSKRTARQQALRTQCGPTMAGQKPISPSTDLQCPLKPDSCTRASQSNGHSERQVTASYLYGFPLDLKSGMRTCRSNYQYANLFIHDSAQQYIHSSTHPSIHPASHPSSHSPCHSCSRG